jgi:spore coat protein M/HSP20 family protein
MKYYVTYNNRYPVSDFDSLFDGIWPDWACQTSKAPAVNIYETDNAYVLEAELAGYGKDDVQVNVDKHVLRIGSVKKADQEQEEQNTLLRERVRGSFERSFAIPENVAEEQIDGEFADGLLTVTLPKKPEIQPKQIEVKVKSA